MGHPAGFPVCLPPGLGTRGSVKPGPSTCLSQPGRGSGRPLHRATPRLLSRHLHHAGRQTRLPHGYLRRPAPRYPAYSPPSSTRPREGLTLRLCEPAPGSPALTPAIHQAETAFSLPPPASEDHPDFDWDAPLPTPACTTAVTRLMFQTISSIGRAGQPVWPIDPAAALHSFQTNSAPAGSVVAKAHYPATRWGLTIRTRTLPPQRCTAWHIASPRPPLSDSPSTSSHPPLARRAPASPPRAPNPPPKPATRSSTHPGPHPRAPGAKLLDQTSSFSSLHTTAWRKPSDGLLRIRLTTSLSFPAPRLPPGGSPRSPLPKPPCVDSSHNTASSAPPPSSLTAPTGPAPVWPFFTSTSGGAPELAPGLAPTAPGSDLLALLTTSPPKTPSACGLPGAEHTSVAATKGPSMGLDIGTGPGLRGKFSLSRPSAGPLHQVRLAPLGPGPARPGPARPLSLFRLSGPYEHGT